MQKIILLLLSIILIVSCSKKPSVKPDETFEVERAWEKANELMAKKDYEEARTAFLEIKSRDLTKKYAPLAQQRIAEIYIKEEDNDHAIEEYRKFLEIYPEDKFAPYAQYQIAMIYFNQIESPDRGYGAASRALEEFERLKRLFPRNPYKEEIAVRIEKSKETLSDHEFGVGTFYYKKESYDAAIKRFEGLLQRFPGFKQEADVLYHLALSYKKLGEKKKAEEYFKLLIEKYPNNKLVPEAKSELLSIKP
ncbi:MAG: outer membrane protein assembly factor BamD [Nitrospirae bacterium]|nr:outer membrane protein assembly factor BamD [Nitrospirota bacterium]